jgi:hypothetical protein
VPSGCLPGLFLKYHFPPSMFTGKGGKMRGVYCWRWLSMLMSRVCHVFKTNCKCTRIWIYHIYGYGVSVGGG